MEEYKTITQGIYKYFNKEDELPHIYKIHPIARILDPFIYKYYYYISDRSEDENQAFYEMLLYEIIPKGYKYQEFVIHYFPN